MADAPDEELYPEDEELYPEDEDTRTSPLDKARKQAAGAGAEAADVAEVAGTDEEGAENVLSVDDLRILDDAQTGLIAELRDDALRARAELVNFRTRVERDRQANRESTIAEVLRALLPALDDLDRAETHGDLPDGSPMAIVAAKLRTAFGKLGLVPFGAKGDLFDPAQHEAIFQQPTPGADSETVFDVLEQGYRFGDRIIRPAKVAVAVPVQD